MLFSKSNFQYTETGRLIHVFDKCLVNTCSIPGTVLGAAVHTMVGKIDDDPVLKGVYIVIGKEADNNKKNTGIIFKGAMKKI